MGPGSADSLSSAFVAIAISVAARPLFVVCRIAPAVPSGEVVDSPYAVVAACA